MKAKIQLNVKKIWLTVIITFLFIMTCTACGKIKLPVSSDMFVGQNYKDVVEQLEEYGFTNIELKEINDLVIGSDMADGAVSEISINENYFFAEKTSFDKTDKVTVTFHTIRKVPLSLTADQLKNESIEKIVDILKTNGFTEIEVDEAEDLDPDISLEPFREILINSSSIIVPTDEKFPLGSKIKIITHYPYAKFNFNLDIDFASNLLFSTYDVDVTIDGNKELTLSHGEDYSGTFRLPPGEHVLIFSKKGDSSIKGEVTIDIQSDVDYKCNIHCYSDEVEVKEISKTENIIEETEAETAEAVEELETEETKPHSVAVEVITTEPQSETTTTNQTEETTESSPQSVYEYAYEKVFNGGASYNTYTIYYLIDIDNQEVIYYMSTDGYGYYGQYTGDINSQIYVTYPSAGYSETITFTNGIGSPASVQMVGDTLSVEFSVASVEKAESFLKSIH